MEAGSVLPDDVPASNLVEILLCDARAKGASDLHVDPMAEGGVVTVRVDGLLERLSVVPAPLLRPLVEAFKRVVGLDPDERRPSVRARSFVGLPDETIDVQLASFPTTRGEALSLRLIGIRDDPPRLDDLLPETITTPLRAALTGGTGGPSGVLLVSGPTGSGKSTVAEAILGEVVAKHDLRVLTIQGEISFHVDGALQAFVTPDFTQVDALRAIQGCDADVIYLDEITSPEVARLVLDHAVRNHLVISTFHAGDAASALADLIVLSGAPARAVAGAVLAVTGQRVVRASCPDCRVLRAPTPEEAARLGIDAGTPVTTNAGCATCDGRGTKGRVAVVEVLRMSPALAASLTRGPADAGSIRRAVPELRSMEDHARERVVTGELSVEVAVAHFERRDVMSLALDELVDEVESERPPIGVSALDGTVTIMFTDLVDSTALTNAIGDAAWMEALRRHQAMVRKHTEAWGGVEVKSTGDGFMLAFASATSAVRCALAIQQAAGDVLLDSGAPLGVKIGLHAGEPVREGDDFYGTTVNVAARVAAVAAAGEVLVSQLVRGLVSSTKDLAFGDARDAELKGLDGPQPLYAVRPWR